MPAPEGWVWGSCPSLGCGEGQGELGDGDMHCQGAAFHSLLALVGFCILAQGCLWSSTTWEKEFPLGHVPVAITAVSEFFIDVIFG